STAKQLPPPPVTALKHCHLPSRTSQSTATASADCMEPLANEIFIWLLHPARGAWMMELGKSQRRSKLKPRETMNCALQVCLLLGLLVSVTSAERPHHEYGGEYHAAKRAALADFRKRFNGWYNVDAEERGRAGHHHRHGKGEHEEKRAALSDFKRAALSDFKRAALADFKRASLADFKRAALADFKRAALSDFKRAALADFKRAALADFKRAALADFKRSHHRHSEGHKGAKGHHHAGKHHGEHKRQLYWDICTRMENGEEKSAGSTFVFQAVSATLELPEPGGDGGDGWRKVRQSAQVASIVPIARQLSQAGCGRLRREVALRFGQHLVADHELLDGGRPKQRRVEDRVQLPVARLARQPAPNPVLVLEYDSFFPTELLLNIVNQHRPVAIPGCLGQGRHPGPDNLFSIGFRQPGQGDVTARMIAHHLAAAARLRHAKQTAAAVTVSVGSISGGQQRRRRRRCVRHERGEIVIEQVGAGVVGINGATGTSGTRAQRISMQTGRRLGRAGFASFGLALPGPLGPVRRHQHPVACQRVEPPVRMVLRLELRMLELIGSVDMHGLHPPPDNVQRVAASLAEQAGHSAEHEPGQGAGVLSGLPSVPPFQSLRVGAGDGGHTGQATGHEPAPVGGLKSTAVDVEQPFILLGTILARVAVLPRHNLSRPSLLYESRRKARQARKLNRVSCVWNQIFVRSSGAMVVLAVAPATAPARKEELSEAKIQIGVQLMNSVRPGKVLAGLKLENLHGHAKATRMPDISGLCNITPATLYRAAKSTVGTVPMDWPYNIILSGCSLYRRPASAGAVAGIIVAEHIDIEPTAQANKEAAHLAQIDCVAVIAKLKLSPFAEVQPQVGSGGRKASLAAMREGSGGQQNRRNRSAQDMTTNSGGKSKLGKLRPTDIF
uniref:Inhibitor_I29 domain-containing protein n=1 Tax=Macrostomum lignano TaxID=282301 RepID=A0A1I8IA06_9PLAT